MPSLLDVPSAADHIKAAADAMRGQRDKRTDTRRGAVYEFLTGKAALLWTREASRDRDMFRAIYFDTAEQDDLTFYIQQRYGISRILDTYGTGTAAFSRPTAGGGAGTIYAGTRIIVPGNDPRAYKVAADTPVAASQTAVSNVPVSATVLGPGQAIQNATGRIDDPLWDLTWSVSSLSCGDGTTYEDSQSYRARTRKALLDQRNGYVTAITTVLRNTGAQNVVLFPSDYSGGTDFGINAIYVGDAGYNSTAALIGQCNVAAEGVRVLGADCLILGMVSSLLTCSLTVTLWDDPGLFDINGITSIAQRIQAGVVQYFTSQGNSFAWKVDGIRGAAARVDPSIQTVTVASVNGMAPPADAVLGTSLGVPWPPQLIRYFTNPNAITVAITGPT